MESPDIVQIIAILIAVTFVLLSVVQRMWQEYVRRKWPEKYEEERRKEEERLKAILGSMGYEEEEPPAIPPPLPAPRRKKAPPVSRPHQAERTLSDEFRFRTDMDQFQQVTRIEGRHLETHVGERFGGDYGQQLVSEDLRERSMKLESVSKGRPARVQEFVRSRNGARALVLSHEILKTPKGY